MRRRGGPFNLKESPEMYDAYDQYKGNQDSFIRPKLPGNSKYDHLGRGVKNGILAITVLYSMASLRKQLELST